MNKNLIKTIFFIVVGGFLGYLYYLKVGCVTGTCAITSNPYISTIYGAVLGVLLSSVFSKTKKKDLD